jgi:hypothetical protein
MSGIDPMTSNMLQAQHAWRPAEIRMNERFVGIQLATNKRGRLGLDLSVFDSTAAAEGMGIRYGCISIAYGNHLSHLHLFACPAIGID